MFYHALINVVSIVGSNDNDDNDLHYNDYNHNNSNNNNDHNHNNHNNHNDDIVFDSANSKHGCLLVNYVVSVSLLDHITAKL